MHVLNGGWQPLSSYDALDTKPRFAVFFFPAIEVNGCSLPEEVKTSREYASRECTHWHPIQDPSVIASKEMTLSDTSTPNKQLTAKQIAALALLVNGKADFHAAIMAGANLSTMSGLVKSGLATQIQNAGVKQWQITDLGISVFREVEKATP